MKEYAGDRILIIQDFTDKDVIKFRDYLLTSLGNTPRTANNTIIHLNTLYRHLKDRVTIRENPFKARKLKEAVTAKNIAFTDQDREAIERYMRNYDPELYIYIRFIYLAFIRPGELNAIQINDIRLQEKYILIRGAISKNGKTETVQMISSLLALISKMNLSRYDPFLYLFGSGLIPGKVITGKQVAFRRHEKVLKSLQLHKKGYTLYSWKHTGAVNAYLSGVGIKQLQMMLRHSTVQMTDIYLKSLGLRTDPNIENYNW
ncbi:tyrosine-type recombinase/integrase [Dyadobacter sp. UP-52]|uniref:Tyrosine-type recombinase/integrase n=1 Tax=Dyadobacter subterraneus TaxID=2773304 RepID=A0ABR9WMV8_9BACT|nr:tyrosine-type recombinase/integrase [Dyadobacter subterraneus]